MKVIASSLRKGNIVDIDGKLGVIVTTENIHPGKGTPVTQMDVRRIADGVKVALRFKTTDQVERAFVEDRKHQFMYQDGDGFHFMNMESYDQVAVPADIIGDQAAYLQPGDGGHHQHARGHARSRSRLPPSAILEVVETEPTMKGQTASSSYKPAVLSNGVRTMVPPFVTTGTKIVVNDRRRQLHRAREGLNKRQGRLGTGGDRQTTRPDSARRRRRRDFAEWRKRSAAHQACRSAAQAKQRNNVRSLGRRISRQGGSARHHGSDLHARHDRDASPT